MYLAQAKSRLKLIEGSLKFFPEEFVIQMRTALYVYLLQEDFTQRYVFVKPSVS